MEKFANVLAFLAIGFMTQSIPGRNGLPPGGHAVPEELLQQGLDERERLRRRVEAARAELDLLELEAALRQAEQGEPSALQQWFAQRGQASHGPATPIESWEVIVPFCEARLKSASPIDARPTGGKDPAEQQAVVGGQWPDPAATGVEAAWPRKDAAPIDGGAGDSLLGGTPQTLGNAGSDPGVVADLTGSARKNGVVGTTEAGSNSKRVAYSAPALAVEMADGSGGIRKRSLVKKVRTRGVAASAIAHLLLLLLLAMVTLRNAPPPTGMAFEAATPMPEEVEVVEMPEPMEVDAPAESTEKVDPPAAVELSDLSEQLAEQFESTELLAVDPASPASPSAVEASKLFASNSAAMATVTAQFFGAAAGGNAFCYVIDGSGSMRGGPWEAAKGGAHPLVGQSPPPSAVLCHFLQPQGSRHRASRGG
ncbi:MAG: hypothetical protein KatS3mg111_2944 [Pirellulaceae bacterium]|nr:MAG: hypothetical protein KatS3mg111_2944 [Pirellulaceae bacterium]